MESYDVVVVGSCNVDFICNVPRLPKVGETIHGSKFTTGCGGKGANQCVAAARLGSRAVLISKLGDDSWGRDFRENMINEGIVTDYLEIVKDQTTGVAQITVATDGSNQIVIVVGANNCLTVDDIEKAKNKILNKSNVLICQLETPIAPTIRALEIFKGISIVNAAPALENTPIELLKLSTIFCVNETEAALMTKLNVISVNDAKKAAKALLEMGCNSVIITLGSEGAVYSSATNPEKTIHVKTPKIENVVDTTGAGDAFVGALAHFLAKNKQYQIEMDQLIGAACEIASITVQYSGTQSSYPKFNKFEAEIPLKKYDWTKI